MTDKTEAARSDRTDFWTGLVLATTGFAIAVESWRMPRLTQRGINPLTVPGLVPSVLGVVLLVLGLVLALRRYGEGRGRVGLRGIIGTGKGRRSLAIALSLNVIFALVLVGRAPFWLATFLYLAAFMGIFGLTEDSAGDFRSRIWRKRAALILMVSSAMTAGIIYLFETLFLVRLP